jgi:L-alanine-DL-glutamate epimerase-like enolase superfamily enzyme
MDVEQIPGDLLGPDYHEQSIAINPIQIEGPITTLNDQPGLGVELDWESLCGWSGQ